MNILTTYTFKYLRLNRKRTGVTILGVILSTALICGVILLGVSFQKMMIDREISYYGNYHARFLGVPFEKAKYIVENRAVELAMVSTADQCTTFGSLNPDKPYLYVAAYDAPSFKNQPVKLIAGRFPQKDGELLVSQDMADGSGLRLAIGRSLTLTAGVRTDATGMKLEGYSPVNEGDKFTPGASKAYTIVGLIQPSFNEQNMDAAYEGYSFMDPAGLAATDLVDVSILARSPRSIYTTAPQIAQSAGLKVNLGSDGLPTLDSISFNEGMLTWMGIRGETSFVRFFLAIIAFIIGLIVTGSALVIYNAFSISIGERKKQFGMFASVGATSGQIRRAVLLEAGVIGAIGIPLGIVGAILGVGITLVATRQIVAQMITGADQGMLLVVSPLVIVLTVLFSAATILLSAWIPARQASRVSPIEAIRLSGDIQENQGRKLKTSPLIRHIFGFEADLALKSLKRDRKKFRTTVASLVISIVLFVAFNALMLYTNTTARMDNQAVNSDLFVYLNGNNRKTPAFVEMAARLPQVTAASRERCQYADFFAPPELVTSQAIQVLGESGFMQLNGGKYQVQTAICAVGPAEFGRFVQKLGLDERKFSNLSAPEGILINHNSLRHNKLFEFDFFQLKAGDAITLAFPSQSEGAQPTDQGFAIGAVTAELPMGISYPSTETRLIVSDILLDGLTTRLGLSEITGGTLAFKGSNPDAMTAAIKKLYKETVGGTPSYYSADENNQRNDMLELMINVFFYGFLTLITLIGVTNIINTLDTNIKLRRREIAMLKSVGLTPGGFLRMLRYESLFYGLTALLYGLPIGIALSLLIYKEFGEISYFSFSLPWKAILVCIAGVLAIVFVTMMISGSMIRNDNIVETIKEENL